MVAHVRLPRLSSILALAYLVLAAPAAFAGEVYADVAAASVTLGNGLVHRTWNPAAFATTELVDERTGLSVGAGADFPLELYAAVIASTLFTVPVCPVAKVAEGGVAVTFVLAPAALVPPCVRRHAAMPAAPFERTYTLWPDVAGFQVDTLARDARRVHRLHARPRRARRRASRRHTTSTPATTGAAPTRSFDWNPTLNPFAGSARRPGPPRHDDRRLARRPRAVAPPRQRRRPRHDLRPARLPGAPARELRLFARGLRRRRRPRARRLSDDLVYLGPFEADVHVDNPAPAPVRAASSTRAQRVAPRARLHRLRRRRRRRGLAALPLPRRARVVGLGRSATSCSTRTASTANRISTGAKDDMDLAETRAPGRARGADRNRDLRARRRLAGGIGRLVPRLAGLPRAAQGDHRLPRPLPGRRVHRGARRAGQHGGMRLGLWMTPMHFNPASDGLSEQPDLGLHADRRRRSRSTTSPSPTRRRTRRGSAPGTRTASGPAAC